MKKIVYYLMFIILMFPTIIFASSTYDDGINIANKYIYDFQDYSRYIKLTGDLPYGINSSNKPVVVSDFKTGGFLNEKEYNMSIRNSASWLAPGIGYWLIGNKILDVRVSASVNANVVSGVRVTEFVKHDAKVKGNGTKTTPWYFTDGYIVKVGSSDLSLGTVTGNCEHVQDGGSCKHTLTYDTKVGVNINNCKKTVESKGATITLNGNELIISNVHSDISCLIDFGNNKCVKVDFNNAGGTGGMTTPIYYKYGFGWFSDGLCLSKVNSLSVPTKTGNRFNGYRYNSILIINENSQIAAGIKENITSNITAVADWEPCGPGKYLSGNTCVSCSEGTYSNGTANTTCTPCTAGKFAAGTGNTSCTPCAAGKYASGTGNTSCAPCAAGKFAAGTGNSICTDCVAGSYSTGTGNSGCTACQNGKTSSTGSTSCGLNCTNTSNVASWKTASWTNNSVSNLCTINSCASGYKISSNTCILDSIFTFKYTGRFQYKDGGNNAVTVAANSNPTQIKINNTNWWVKFLTSGTLTVNSINSKVDVFLVGGGGGAGGCTETRGGGGGGGGYTTTYTNFAISARSYGITIGNGGNCGSSGGSSSAFGYSAAGGGAGASFWSGGRGGNGGSGGGGCFGGNGWPTPTGTGGSNGSAGTDGRVSTFAANGGYNRYHYGGSGCSSNGGCKKNGATCTNTRAFCESGGELYAGGGAGGDHEYCGKYGDGGGGGANSACVCGCEGHKAVANYGGGGAMAAGSSGVVILRNKR